MILIQKELSDLLVWEALSVFSGTKGNVYVVTSVLYKTELCVAESVPLDADIVYTSKSDNSF